MTAQASAPSNEELVAGLKAGEPGAYRQLMRAYERRLFAFALGMLRDPDEAMDVVQDTFMRVFRKIDTFKGNAAFSTWLFRIARNLCIDRFRRKKRVPMGEFDDGVRHDNMPVGAPVLLSSMARDTPVRSSLRRELGQELRAALEMLSEDHREILVLREIEGMSYADMAETLSVPIGTVMSRLFHARKNMQKRLRRYLEPEPARSHGN